MARTGAERQAAYRARQSEASDQRRVSTWINADAALALETLSDRYGVTMREVIEILLLRECGVAGKLLINKNLKEEKVGRKRRSLPRNVIDAARQIDEVHSGLLLRNVEHEKTIDVTPLLTIDESPALSRGEQYSLDL